VPVIAAGGIGDGRGIAAAFALGAAGVQIGTGYLLCPEAATSTLHREALKQAHSDATVVTNVFSGRPARALINRLSRELGPLASDAPGFPIPMGVNAPLRTGAEKRGIADFSAHWSGQAIRLSVEMAAEELTRAVAEAALQRLRRLLW
jgi:nitronate monooxygenase